MKRMLNDEQIFELQALLQNGATTGLEWLNNIRSKLSFADDTFSFDGDVDVDGDITATGDLSADAITGNSIIENMSGYSFVAGTREGFTLTPIYVSAVKNGNKLTFVQFMKIVRTEEFSGNDFISLGQLTIPEQIGQKLTPYTIAGQPAVDNKQVPLFLAPSSQANNKAVLINKDSNTILQTYMYGISTLNLNSEYIFRVESTFLLSDNLVQTGE